MNNNSNRDYATENINLKQQVIDLKVANKDKAETIKAMKQELLEYSQLRDRFKVLYEENQELKKEYNLLDTTMESDDRIICELLKEKEQLQNDIKLNETQIDDLTLEVANYKHALEEKNEIIFDLKKENKELETTLLEYKAQENLYWNTATNNVNLREENDKLKKAIEILKEYLNIEVDIDTRTIITDVGDTSIVGATKEDVEDLILLKEVLEC